MKAEFEQEQQQGGLGVEPGGKADGEEFDQLEPLVLGDGLAGVGLKDWRLLQGISCGCGLMPFRIAETL